jgi:SAM-dependent methyltransferase
MTNPIPKPVILDSLEEPVFRATATVAGVQLGVFTSLQDGPLTAAQLAEALGVEMPRLRSLLYALVIVGLLAEKDGLFSNSAEADTYLVRGRPSYQGHLAGFWSNIWRAALVTGESIRTGKPQSPIDYEAMLAAELEEFLRGMYPGTYTLGTVLAQNHDIASCRSIVDVGGGSGALSIALTAALPQLQALVVDLPNVVPITRRIVDWANASQRVQVQAVDVIREPLVGSFDAALAKSFLHMFSLADAAQALVNIHTALRPGGVIYVLDGPLDDSRLSPTNMVMWSPVFHAIYAHGRKYTVQEYQDLLRETGYTGFAFDPSSRFITARKP